MKMFTPPCLAVVILPGDCLASGEIRVEAFNYSGGAVSNMGAFPANKDADTAFEINEITPDIETVAVYSNVDPPANLGRITLRATGTARTSAFTLKLGPGRYTADGGPPPSQPAVHNWAGCVVDAGLRQYAKVAGRVGGSVTGTVSAGGVRDLYIDGNVAASLDMLAGPFSSLGQFTHLDIGGSILAGGSITAGWGDIEFVRVEGGVYGAIACADGAVKSLTVIGDLAAQVKAGTIGGVQRDITSVVVQGALLHSLAPTPDIYAPNGRVKSLTVAGDIGTPGAPVRIEWRGNTTDGPCQLIAGRFIFADINATDADSELNRVQAGFDLSGSLTCGKLKYVNGNSGIVVARDCNANVHILGDVDAPIIVNNYLSAGSTITIGSKLFCPNSSCTSPTVIIPIQTGLQGQVVINAIDDGREWFGNVLVGSTTLSPIPLYSQSKSVIGGGSVGRLKFDLHTIDCVPLVSRTIRIQADPPLGTPRIKPSAAPCPGGPVLLENYGPIANVAVPNTDKSAVNFEYRVGTGFGWASRPDLISTVSVNPAAPRVLGVTPTTLLPPGQYRITPDPMKVKCVLLGSASSVGVAGYTAWFEVKDTCPGDLNGDGLVNTADLTLLLVHFGQMGVNGCSLVGDMNTDLTVNTADLTQLLVHFGTQCTADDPPPEDPPPDGLMASPPSHPGALWPSSVVRIATAPTGAGDEGGTAQSAQTQAATPPGVVLVALGFTSAEQYQAYVESLAEAQFAVHMIDVLDTIKRLGLQ